MNQKQLHVALLAGGSGLRLWPLSTHHKPKPFQDLQGGSLLKNTIQYFDQLIPLQNVWVVTNQKYRTLVEAELPLMAKKNIILEPSQSNTHLAIAYATYQIRKENPEAMIIYTPVDYVIRKVKKFQKDLITAIQYSAQNKKLVTLAVKSKYFDDKFGYLKVDSSYHQQIFTTGQFIFSGEKHSKLMEKDMYLHTGIFIASADLLTSIYEKHFKALASSVEKAFKKNICECIKDFYNKKRNNITFEKAFFNKKAILKKLYTCIGNFGWEDLGSWDSIYENSSKDNQQNVLQGNVKAYETQNCFVKSDKNSILTYGVKNLMIIEHENRLLVCKANHYKKIKKVLKISQEYHDE